MKVPAAQAAENLNYQMFTKSIEVSILSGRHGQQWSSNRD
jgi:hypothetical protein